MQDLLGRVEVQRMRQFVQHGNISTFDHCLSVALLSYALVKLLHLPVNRRTLVLGAFLHDFYLYDWHKNKSFHRKEGYLFAKCR